MAEEQNHRIADEILKAAEYFDDTRDCSCDGEYEDSVYCWYRLSDEEKRQEKAHYLAAQLPAIVFSAETGSLIASVRTQYRRTALTRRPGEFMKGA